MACRSPTNRRGRTLRAPVRCNVESLAFGGDAVARDDTGRVVFVPLAAPGDQIEVKLTEEHKRYARGELKEVVKPGAARVTPPCGLFAQCGGCQWQHVAYDEQLASKQQIVKHALRHAIDGETEVLAPVRAPTALGYRRRARFSVRQRGDAFAVGFRARRSHEMVDVPSCPLLVPAIANVYGELADWWRKFATRVGPLTVEVVAGDDGAIHLFIDRAPDDSARTEAALLCERGVVRGIAFEGRRRELWGDEGETLDSAEALPTSPRVEIGAPSVNIASAGEAPLWVSADDFAQANSEQNGALVRRVVEAAKPASRRILELHAGGGNFTRALLAGGAEQVIAVESAARAVSRGKQVTEGQPAVWHVGDAAAAVANFAGEYSCLLLDPPRAGDEAVTKAIASLSELQRPERVVYVSCDPMTLARDLGHLRAAGYRLLRIGLVDMMPQTFHVEMVAELALERRS